MRTPSIQALLIAFLFVLANLPASGDARADTTPSSPDSLNKPVVEGKWVRPAPNAPAQPLWGHAEGMRVGLVPPGGPRGLLRIYTPYLGHADNRLINFIAVEPIPAGETHRGLSELEHSELDGVRGKRMWSANDPADATPRAPDAPARGEIVTIDGVEALRVYVLVERFDNKAHVYVRMTFRSDRPREVALATFAHDDSTPLEHCILTATMGNYARLRKLHLAEKTISSLDLWPDYRDSNFAPHARFPLSVLTRTPEGAALVSATPDEANPEQAAYATGTRKHWRYIGQRATQTWRHDAPPPELQAWVNGRYTYWASRSPIPGGISFENFEMVTPFRQGEEFRFSIEPGVIGEAEATSK